MNPKKSRQILMILWVLLLIFNIIVSLWNPTFFNLFLLGLGVGFLIHMAISHPLFSVYENHIDLLTNFYEKVRKELDKKLNSKRRKSR